MAHYFAPPLSVLAPFFFLSLGSALLFPQLGLYVATIAHSVGEEYFAPCLPTPILKYENEVFISFHAEDTRTRFTGHLFAALERERIRASELMKAIETSRIAVVVFSKNYATSNWCLDGLVKIMECKRVLNQTVLPIFYGVSPSDVQKLMGNLVEAILNGHEDKVNIWEATLKDVANLAGFHLKPDRPEPEFIEEIVGTIWKILDVERVQPVVRTLFKMLLLGGPTGFFFFFFFFP